MLEMNEPFPRTHFDDSNRDHVKCDDGAFIAVENNWRFVAELEDVFHVNVYRKKRGNQQKQNFMHFSP